MSFAEVLKQIKSLGYEAIMSDFALVRHILRFLQFRTISKEAVEEDLRFKGRR